MAFPRTACNASSVGSTDRLTRKKSSSSRHDQTPKRIKMNRNDVYVFSHTHWDREWYLSQRQFQVLLARTLDGVLDVLECESVLRTFVAAGQTSILEDYLELRPANLARLQRLVTEGRILVGPWYTMPDLWLPSGEALVRNLLHGRIDCEALGVSPQDVGYVPDSFGHVEQMPQILRGFGIDHYLFSRGRPEAVSNCLEFVWQSPGGNGEVVAHCLPQGYQNGAMLPAAGNVDAIEKRMRSTIDEYARTSSRPDLSLLCNGVDHIWVQGDLPDVLAAAESALPDATFHHGSILDYLDAFDRRDPAAQPLPPYRGVLRRNYQQSGELHGTWSSRIDNKLDNDRCLRFLERVAEPLLALARRSGVDVGEAEMHLAWRLALQNHAHDSICGCSDDRVHEDIAARFRQSLELAEMIVQETLRDWNANVAAGEAALLRLNGLAGGGGVHELRIDSASPTPPEIVDENGDALATQPLSTRKLRRWDVVMRDDADYDEERFEFHEHRLAVALPDAPPCTIQQYAMSDQSASGATGTADECHASDSVLSNRHLRVVLRRDGAIDVFDFASETWFRGLLAMTDEADLGGGYYFAPAPGDKPESSAENGGVRIEVLETGPLRAAVEIAYDWRLAASLDPTMQQRSTARVACPVRLRIALTQDSRSLDVRLRLDNRAIGHRVRLAMPLPFSTREATVERAFVVAHDDLGAYRTDPGQDTHPMRNWVSAAGGGCGLAFVGTGQHEYALDRTGEETSLMITLLRSVEYVLVSGGWATPDARLLGPIEHRFALLFHDGDWRDGQVAERAAAWLNPPLLEPLAGPQPAWSDRMHASVRFEAETEDPWRITPSQRPSWRTYFAERDGWRRSEAAPATPPLPETPMFRIDAEHIVLDCFKPAERGDDDASPRPLVLRFHSVHDRAQEAQLRFADDVVRVHLADLAETPLDEAELVDGRLGLRVKPFEIVTLLLSTASTHRDEYDPLTESDR